MNIFDGLIALLSILDFSLGYFLESGASFVGVIKVFRTIRVLRVIRLLR